MNRLRAALRALPAVAAGFLAAISLGCLPAVEESSVETISRPAAPRVVIRLDRGSLHVREHLGGRIEVEIHRSAQGASREAALAALEALVVELEDDASGALRLAGRSAAAGAFRPFDQLGLRLRVGVPAGTAVDARTASGRIELEGLTGPVRATSASGRIVATDLRSPPGTDGETAGAPVVLRAHDGRIEGRGLEGRFRAETGEGRIRLRGRLEQVDAFAGDGRVEVEAVAGGPPLAGDWFLRSGNGSVRLTLPRSARVELTALGNTSDDDSGFPGWRRAGPVARATLGAGPEPRSGTGAGTPATDRAEPRIHLQTPDGSVRVTTGDRN